MQSRAQSLPHDWYTATLQHLLLRHHQSLNEEETNEVTNLYLAANALTATPLDQLEILRLFEWALSQHEAFKSAGCSLSTLDLFFACMTTGLKLYMETHRYEITLDEIKSKLPKDSRYQKPANEAATIERAFHKGMNWKIQTLSDTAFDDYIKLLKPLDTDALNQFSAMYLLVTTTSTDGYDLPQSVLHSVLCELNPSFKEQAQLIIRKIKSTPLLYAFIENENARNALTDDIISQLKVDKSTFEYSADTNNAICQSIGNYFVNRKRTPSLNDDKALQHYFSPDQVTSISIQNQLKRLDKVKSQSSKNSNSQSHRLIQGVKNDLNFLRIDKTWLEPILLSFEAINKTQDLTAEIITTTLTDRTKSEFIVNIYSALHTEGWLSVINTSNELRKNVAEILFKGRDSTSEDLLLMLKSAIKIHFILNTPDKSVLTLMSKINNPSTQDATLINHITLTCYSKLKAELIDQFDDLSINATNHFIEFDAYFSTNTNASFALLRSLMIVKKSIDPINASTCLAILERPEQCRFRAALTRSIQQAFNPYGLYEIQIKLTNLYKLVFESVNRDVALLMDIDRFFTTRTRATKDDLFSLDTLPAVKTHLRTVIDTAIQDGSLVLTEEEDEDLTCFYEIYEVPTPVASKRQSSSSARLFAPKPIHGEALNATIETPVTTPSPTS